MEKKTYLNRYSDKILFERIDTLKFRMSGFISYSLRRITDESGRICAIDPSGGPYIENKIHGFGTNMGQFNGKWKYFNVEHINPVEGSGSPSVIKECTYDPVIKWKKIKNPA